MEGTSRSRLPASLSDSPDRAQRAQEELTFTARPCHLIRVILFMLVGTTFGCSGGKPATVSGRVTLDGQPVQGGNVAFEPQDGGMMAFSEIDSSGNYQLQTNQERGLMPGFYRVKVISREKTIAPPTGGLPPPGKLLVPERYTRVETSRLSFEVAAGDHRFDLDLHSQ